MVRRVNLLPWRQLRRHRFWRFWSLLWLGSLLVIGLLTFSQYRLLAADRAMLSVKQNGNALLLQRLAVYRQSLSLRQHQAEAIQARRQQRAQTRRWQQTLVEIAGRLPGRIWLTELAFRQGILTLNGYSLTLSDLSRLDAALADIPGLRHGKAGQTRRVAQGRWQFHYQLKEEPDRVAEP